MQKYFRRGGGNIFKPLWDLRVNLANYRKTVRRLIMEKPKKILISGGSGMIGGRLTTYLQDREYEVAHLGRSVRKSSIRTFVWDPSKNIIDKKALDGVDTVIHLAGAGIADRRWTKRRKEEILLSRTQSTRLLRETMQAHAHQVKTFISASGISYYGLNSPQNNAFVESDPPANDFMAGVALAWEKEVREINDPAIRRVIIRTGVVLTREGGALKKLVMPVKFFVGAPLGSGSQFFNWIHLDDLCRLYLKAIEDPKMSGPYNAVAPNPVTNRELTRMIAHILKRPVILPAVPALIVRLVAGEVAEVVLKGGKISSEKIERAGFDFKFRTIDKALQELLT